MDHPDKISAHETFKEREVEILRLMAEGLTNREIADRLFLGVETVRWYAKQIYGKLGVESREEASARAGELGLLDSEPFPPQEAQAPRFVLPEPLTLFIGRQREMDEILHLLDGTRLLTLTGPGGTGKTRLALKVAEASSGDFVDGARFVALAPLSNPALVVKAIADALEVVENPSESLPNTLKRVLAGREYLLLLDNFEHVIEAAPLVAELLLSAPRLKVLVTSREVLRLSGEQEYAVPPLSLPAAASGSAQEVIESEAGLLFMQRARMALPGFGINESNAFAVAQLCARLDGLPLAIELAAARCKMISPQAMLSRLESSLTLLTGGSRDAPHRQQTLRNTIKWSYDLLDDREKALFARLSVFQGGRSLEAIEAICAPDLPGFVFDTLASLVDKSLVQKREMPDGEPRFVMLETIHEYARERLEASDDAEAVRARHATYFVELAERAQPQLRLAQHFRWSRLLQLEHDNIRAAFAWLMRSGNITLAVRLAGALTLFWFGFGHHIEGRYWIDQLAGRLGEVPAEYHARFLISAGHIYSAQNDLESARLAYKQSLDVSRESGDRRHTAWSLIFLAYSMLGETDPAIAMAEEGLTLFREMDHRPGIAQALNIIGEIARFGGEDERARRAYEECLVVAQETGETRRNLLVLYNLAFLAQHEGDHERAIDLIRQGILLARKINNRLEMSEGLAYLSGSLAVMGKPQMAARLLGVWEAVLEHLGAFTQPADRPEIDRSIATVRAQLDEATFRASWAEGRATPLEQAVIDALSALPV